MKYFLLSIAICTSLIAHSFCFAGSNNVLGEWRLTYDPDGPVVDDRMVFLPNKMCEMKEGDQTYLSCPYTVKSNSIIIACKVRSKTKKLVMKLRSDDTMANQCGALYSKQ